MRTATRARFDPAGSTRGLCFRRPPRPLAEPRRSTAPGRTRAGTAILATCLVLGLAQAAAAACRGDVFEGVPYTACTVDPAAETLRLWHRDARGAVYGTFGRLNDALAETGRTLGIAMNGAMYHEDRSAVGLYVEDGRELAPLATGPGPGNFGLVPNGVLCIGTDSARVIETGAFAAARPACRYAMQSGPLLVIDGLLHPRFLPKSRSRYIRNGVGSRRDGTVVLAMAEAPVNLHRFARLFRDRLGAPDALYIDGKVSRLYDRASGRHDLGFPVGPILGTAVPLD